MEAEFEMKDLGDAKKYYGNGDSQRHNQKKKRLKISQEIYVRTTME